MRGSVNGTLRSIISTLIAIGPALALGALAAMAAPPRAAEAKRAITLDDFARIVTISGPSISPGGTQVAAVISRVNMKEDRRDTQLVVIDVANGATHPLTWDRRGVSTPRWSPDGNRLAFLAQAPTGKEKKEKAQVFAISMAGGDAHQLTEAPEGVEQYSWSPDGKTIAYATPDSPDAKAVARHVDSFVMGDDGLFTSAEPLPQHIWLVDADGTHNRRLTSGKWSLPKSAPNVPPPPKLSWSAGGHSIVFPRRATPSIGDWDESTIWSVDVETGKLHKLTAHPKFEEAPLYSPDGKQVSYLFPRAGQPSNLTDVYVAPAAGGDGLDITAPLDRDIHMARWMPGSKALLVEAVQGTNRYLWIQPVRGAARKLSLGDLQPGALSVGPRGAVAFVATTPERGSELYYLSSPAAQPRRLTDVNVWMSELALGKSEGFDWQGPNGFHEDGVAIYPPDFTAGGKYPLVLVIHGGPRSASTVGFNFLGQILAAHGFVVFSPNYRGSTNLGSAYGKAIFGDAGDGPGRDVMAGIAALEKHVSIDTSRIGVSGWSYGGYMTTWLIGHYTIWKTAVAGAPVTDFVNQYNWADNNVARKYIYSGSPWVGDNMARYRQQSPITYASHVRTPVLLLHDVRDPRVSITNSFEFFHALRDNGLPVKFIAFPVVGHFPPDPVHQLMAYTDWSGWMVDHLK